MANTKLSAWEKVEIARNPKRKTSLDYIYEIFDTFIELHGDRAFRDDKAMVCGLASIGNQNFTIIAEQKGRTTKENHSGRGGRRTPASENRKNKKQREPQIPKQSCRKPIRRRQSAGTLYGICGAARNRRCLARTE